MSTSRRGRPTGRVIGLIIGVALLVAGCGVTVSGPEMKEAIERYTSAMEQQARSVQQVKKIGEPITHPNGEQVTVTRVRAEAAGHTPAEGERLVVVEVELVNSSVEPLPLNADPSFWLSDRTGRQYKPIETPGLPTTSLAPGSRASGQVIFSVPTTATELRFGWERVPILRYLID